MRHLEADLKTEINVEREHRKEMYKLQVSMQGLDSKLMEKVEKRRRAE